MYMYACMYVCMYICMYVYIYTHAMSHKQSSCKQELLIWNTFCQIKYSSFL